MRKHQFMNAVFILLGMAIGGSLFAQPVRLTPDEAVERALKNNLSLESARASSGTKKRASDLSWNQFIPNVDVGGALLRLNEAPAEMLMDLNAIMPNMNLPTISLGGGGPQWRLAGSISASLNLNFAMFQDMKRLRMDYEKGLISYEKAKSQLERDVRKAYHNMLLLQENIALLRGSFENAERQVQIARANYNAGLAPELTLLQAQVGRENLRPIIDQAENGLRLAMAQFSMLLGLPAEPAGIDNPPYELIPITEDTSFIPLDVSELIKKAASGKPDIMELRQDILSLDSMKKSTAYRLYTPTLSLNWNADPSFSGDPWKDPWFENMDNWKQQSGSFRISLGFRLNGLLPIGSERQGLKTLDDQIVIANIGLAQLIRGTEIEIYNTVLALERTRISKETLAQTVNLAERSYQLTENAYRAGLQDLFQVQNAEQSLRQARVQVLEQQFNYLNGLLDLEYAIGVPFGTLTSKESK